MKRIEKIKEKKTSIVKKNNYRQLNFDPRQRGRQSKGGDESSDDISQDTVDDTSDDDVEVSDG